MAYGETLANQPIEVDIESVEGLVQTLIPGDQFFEEEDKILSNCLNSIGICQSSFSTAYDGTTNYIVSGCHLCRKNC
jgi:hypothetical protein